jgi:hypothetical protein
MSKKLYIDMTPDEKLKDQLVQLHKLREEMTDLEYRMALVKMRIEELVRDYDLEHPAISITRPTPQVVIAADLYGYGIEEIDGAIEDEIIDG